MFWFNVAVITTLGVALGASSCSVQPLYGTAASTSTAVVVLVKEKEKTSKVEKRFKKHIAPLFANASEDANNPTYRLDFSLKLARKNLVVQSNREVSQGLQQGNLQWTLYDEKNKKLREGSITDSVRFTQTSPSHLARNAARKGAEKKLLERLAATLQQRVLAFYLQQ